MSLGVSGYSASIGPSAASNNKHFMNKKVSSPKPPPYYNTNQKRISNNKGINVRDQEEEMDKV